MKQHRLFSIVVAIISVGWLIPLWLGVDTYMSFWHAEVLPRLLGESPANSFPYIAFAASCFKVAFLWLGLVICFWAYWAFSTNFGRRAVYESIDAEPASGRLNSGDKN